LFTNPESATKRIICLHSPGTTPPKPLRHLQAYEVTPERMSKFLHELFGETCLTGLTEPINPAWADDEEERKKVADHFCSLLVPRIIQRVYVNKFITIEIPDRKKLSKTSFPDDAVVRSEESFMRELFNVPQPTIRWDELNRRIREDAKETRWIDQLIEAVFQGQECAEPPQIYATYNDHRGCTYRPVLYRIDRVTDGSIRYHVVFIDEVLPRAGETPPPLEIIASFVNAAVRYKYEVIEWCLNRESGPATPAEPALACGQVQRRIQNIVRETVSRTRLLRRENLLMVFPGAEARQNIQSLYQEWEAIHARLFAALDRHDVNAGFAAIRELREVDARFLQMAAPRYSELLLEYARE
jgi:hypothetical protein